MPPKKKTETTPAPAKAPPLTNAQMDFAQSPMFPTREPLSEFAGLTKWAWFAGCALAGLCSGRDYSPGPGATATVCALAADMADEMCRVCDPAQEEPVSTVVV